MTTDQRLRIGVDLGGTKIEAMRMLPSGDIETRVRAATPKDDYQGTVDAIADSIRRVAPADAPYSIGICTPGTKSPTTGLMRNCNSVCLNGQPLQSDIEAAVGQPIKMANDANCLAVSEAKDGAAAGANLVFAVIIGTGTGGGIAIGGQVHNGLNYLGGEWGHMPLPWRSAEDTPGLECFCGKRGCNEKYISGTGLEIDYRRLGGAALPSTEIAKRMEAGEALAAEAVARYEQRLAQGLALIVNFLDPEVIVLGGGMSNLLRLYDNLPRLMLPWILGGECITPIRRAKHGDSSGIRGAAWLWE